MTAKHILSDLYDPFKRGHTSDNPIKWECVQTFRKLTLVSATHFCWCVFALRGGCGGVARCGGCSDGEENGSSLHESYI